MWSSSKVNLKKLESKSKISNKEVHRSAGKGMLMILSAPSGCGKTTIVDRLLRRHPDWVRSVSATTRVPRSGEDKEKDYFFVTRAAFKEMEKKDELLESTKVFGHSYGTPKKFVLNHLKQGHYVLLAIDIQGTKKVKKILNGKIPILTIFVLPPSVKILRERLEGRNTESPDEVQRRIEAAQEEIKEAAFYDFTVVNQNLEQSVAVIEGFIKKFIRRGEP